MSIGLSPSRMMRLQSKQGKVDRVRWWSQKELETPFGPDTNQDGGIRQKSQGKTGTDNNHQGRGLNMLSLSRKVGEKLTIGDSVTVTVLGLKGNQIRIGIEAPRDMQIERPDGAAPAEVELQFEFRKAS